MLHYGVVQSWPIQISYISVLSSRVERNIPVHGRPRKALPQAFYVAVFMTQNPTSGTSCTFTYIYIYVCTCIHTYVYEILLPSLWRAGKASASDIPPMLEMSCFPLWWGSEPEMNFPQLHVNLIRSKLMGKCQMCYWLPYLVLMKVVELFLFFGVFGKKRVGSIRFCSRCLESSLHPPQTHKGWRG